LRSDDKGVPLALPPLLLPHHQQLPEQQSRSARACPIAGSGCPCVCSSKSVSGIHVPHFLYCVRELWLPHLRRGDVLVMDLLSHHLRQEVAQMLYEKGVFAFFLPSGACALVSARFLAGSAC
jgi:hypothetical protein